jgi:glycosyltransferase involved in cell wall biosynthesis
VKLTIGIKALNEEEHIAAALASALAAAAPFGGEVILADSGSQDRTIEIARGLPVRIVQLANVAERSCGIGAQLAFQEAKGDYFYLLDGDMVLDPGFVAEAVAYLDDQPGMAGVGGRIAEMNVDNAEFRIRVANAERDWRAGVVDRLDGGGLYRAQAVREAGYFADRNLHAFEELDLATRLRARGWQLARIDRVAARHYSHREESYALMWRRLKSGYAGAPGEVLRGALGAPHLGAILKSLGHIRNGLAVIAWWGLIVAAVATGRPWATLALIGVPLGFLWYRRGSLSLGLYSFAMWNSVAVGLVSGFLRRRKPPGAVIAANDLTGSGAR